MRFLVDMGISPRSASFLRDLGHDTIHLHDEGLDRLSDAHILAKARTEGRIVLTHELNDYAVDIRYPGESATSEEAQAAVKAMRTARSLMRSKLGLPQR